MIGLLMLAAAQAATPLIERPPAERPAMMIVASPHLANNNRDMVKTAIEDVTTPARQREIEALVAMLAEFRPTRVAIEWDQDDQATLDQRYADYRAGRLKLTANERDQIGLRLAAKLGLPKVEAVDWNGAPPGDQGDYDFFAWAAANGQVDRLKALIARSQAETDARTTRWRRQPISGWYTEMNQPAFWAADHRVYYDLALTGDERAAPGAAWVGTWYARNLRIFGNLVRIAKPKDRLLVLYGSGHAHLLTQFARESHAFDLVDAITYLPKPSSARQP